MWHVWSTAVYALMCRAFECAASDGLLLYELAAVADPLRHHGPLLLLSSVCRSDPSHTACTLAAVYFSARQIWKGAVVSAVNICVAAQTLVTLLHSCCCLLFCAADIPGDSVGYSSYDPYSVTMDNMSVFSAASSVVNPSSMRGIVHRCVPSRKETEETQTKHQTQSYMRGIA